MRKSDRSDRVHGSRQCLTAAAACVALGCSPADVPRAAAPVSYTGICDASGATAIGPDRFIVADDEDGSLRVYDAARGGNAVRIFDAGAVAGIGGGDAELDLEGSAALGDAIFWISSHGRDRKGRLAPSRRLLFATAVNEDGSIAPVGNPYSGLATDMESDERLVALGVSATIGSEVRRDPRRTPKADGLNLEGLAAAPDGTGLYLGLRNPLVNGRAVVLPLENPDELIAGDARARFGEPILLDLEGRGISGMERVPRHGGYLLIAAPRSGPGEFAFYRWSGARDAAPRKLFGLDDPGLRPEAVVAYEDRVLLLSDDGDTQVRGVRCKRLRDASAKSFRGLSVLVPSSD